MIARTPVPAPEPQRRGRGRPRIGKTVQVHLPDDLLARIDELAVADDATRSEEIRALLRAGLRRRR